MLRVRPDGVAASGAAHALRDRLNAMLSDMIHQHKRIELRNLREVERGGYAATVIVNGADVAGDAALLRLAP